MKRHSLSLKQANMTRNTKDKLATTNYNIQRRYLYNLECVALLMFYPFGFVVRANTLRALLARPQIISQEYTEFHLVCIVNSQLGSASPGNLCDRNRNRHLHCSYYQGHTRYLQVTVILYIYW